MRKNNTPLLILCGSMLLPSMLFAKRETPSAQFVKHVESIIQKKGLHGQYKNLPPEHKLSIVQGVSRQNFVHPHHGLSEVDMLNELKKKEKEHKKS